MKLAAIIVTLTVIAFFAWTCIRASKSNESGDL